MWETNVPCWTTKESLHCVCMFCKLIMWGSACMGRTLCPHLFARSLWIILRMLTSMVTLLIMLSIDFSMCKIFRVASICSCWLHGLWTVSIVGCLCSVNINMNYSCLEAWMFKFAVRMMHQRAPSKEHVDTSPTLHLLWTGTMFFCTMLASAHLQQLQIAFLQLHLSSWISDMSFCV